jgi:ATP/maltotriose-dependent transcriptional regulator MalT/DNA-binding CsgD family transcriptional regulator
MSLTRERLIALLADSALTSVELVIAPPGFGKTTLLREYASAETGAAFVVLPEGADLEAFVRCVIAATVPSALRSIGAVFETPATENIEQRAGEWLVSRLREFSGTLIVDDFHRAVADERVARVLVGAIAATHGRMRWIVASRESPAFPMGSWIARGWMGLPITGDDLAFTAEEAGELAKSLEIFVSNDGLTAIVDDTLGWPIGVRLALSLVARKRDTGQTRVQTREALFALLDDEVWQPLDHGLKSLVAAAALMPAPTISTLIAAGYADARAGMTSVFAKVPFITAIDDSAFIIHDLFRDFVTTQASPENTNGTDAVANRVGSALVAAGNPADGLRLLIAAGRIDDVQDALAVHAFDLLETGQRGVINAAMTFLGERSLNDTGIALAIRGALAFADGSASNSTNLFVRALGRKMPPAIRSEVSRRLALAYANRGMLHEALDALKPLEADVSISLEDRLEAQAMAAAFISATGTSDRADVEATIVKLEAQISRVPPNVQVRLLRYLGNAALANRDPERAERLSLDAALLATELGMDTFAALAYSTLYSLAARNDPDATRARSFSRSQAIAAERAANTALRVYALRAQYIIAATNVEVEEAQTLESTMASLVDTRTYRDAFHFRFARALQSVATGDIAKAESSLRSMPQTSISAAERIRLEAFLLILLLLRGKRSEVATVIERSLLAEAPRDHGGRIEMAYAYAYRGIAYWALDRPAQARKAFEFNTADLPRRDRLVVDVFKALAHLPHPLPGSGDIDRLASSLVAGSYRAYAELLVQFVELDANDVALSPTELETLREFDRHGGRAADVARALGKSKFTVQNQIQSAIRKLGCSGRAEALAYARQRGWLHRA